MDTKLVSYDKLKKSILDHIYLGIVISDKEGNIKILNEKTVEMFSYSYNELINMKMFQLFKGWKEIKSSVLKNESFTGKEVYVNARRNKLRFHLRVYPVLNESENIKDILYIFDEFKKKRKLANKIIDRGAIYTFDKIIGKSENFQKAIGFSKKVADSKSTMLITGESGTGKEVFAQSIHNYSNRKNAPFIAINCGAIPRNLIESELFGYEEGAFTGAKKSGKIGKFEVADGGTVFLDEIGELPLDLQTRLLRVLEEGTVSRIGSTREKVVDVRIIVASNKDLREAVKKGKFRRDLFYRVNVLPLRLPPLRERRDDIPLLIDYFMEKISKDLNKKQVKISTEKMEKIMKYEWPGNVRELENFVELIINVEAVPVNIGRDKKDIPLNINSLENKENKDMSLDTMEKNHIIKVLEFHSGNITQSAKTLGIARNTLYRKIEKYNIDCSRIERCSNLEQ
ncbi:MAG TPA: sigma 54-interacting transcriptional regulator [Tissierellales bacterium]|nr:sigma 54-interacting transcriptional regulator [Tissierellales bacterium]